MCLAPRSSNARQLQQNLAALDDGPLSDDEMAFMRAFGDAVHHTKKWFMETEHAGQAVGEDGSLAGAGSDASSGNPR